MVLLLPGRPTHEHSPAGSKKIDALKKILSSIYFWSTVAVLVGIFAFSCISNREKQPCIQIEITASQASILQFFYSESTNFAEHKTFQHPLVPGKNTLKFTFPEKQTDKVGYFRIDPSFAAKNRFILHKIHFWNGSNAYELKTAQILQLSKNQLTCKPLSGNKLEIVTTGNDPHFILPVSDFNKVPVMCSSPVLKAYCNTAAAAGIMLLAGLLFYAACYWKNGGIVYRIFQWLAQKGILRRTGILASGILAATIVYWIVAPSARVEIELETDQTTWMQLFLRTNKEFSQQNSFFVYVKQGHQKLSFAVPDSCASGLSELRFDPTNDSGITVKIKKFTVYRNDTAYNLQPENFKKLSHSGIKLLDISSRGISLQSTNKDAQISIPFSSLSKRSRSGSDSTVFYMVAGGFLLGLLLSTGLFKGGKWRKYTLYGIGGAAAIGTLAVLLYCTEYLGKFSLAVVLLWLLRLFAARIRKEPAAPVKPPKPNFDWSMHYFRALAISCICIGHMIGGVGTMYDRFFLSDSIYFLFISGYLCQYLFDKKPDTPLAYYKKKLFNVLCPYLIFSFLLIAFRLYLCEKQWNTPLLYYGDDSPQKIFRALIQGNAVGCYWYIPFVTVLFLFSPLICRLKDKGFQCGLFIFAVLSILFPQRGVLSITNWKSTVNLYTYFTFSYFFGMLFARKREQLEPYFKKISLPALLAGIALIALIGNEDFPLQTGNMNFLQAIQKYCFIIAVIPLLTLFSKKKNALLNNLAVFSFSIFFLHLIFYLDFTILLDILTSWNIYLAESKFNGTCLLNIFALLLGTGFLFIMLFLSIMLKKIFGKASRYIIGS